VQDEAAGLPVGGIFTDGAKKLRAPSILSERSESKDLLLVSL